MGEFMYKKPPTGKRETIMGEVRSVRIILPTATLGLAVLAGCPQAPPDTGNQKRVISTVVGTGDAGDNGDGLSGPETALYLVQDVTVGPDGNLYFPDWNNHKIKRLINGVVETIAGTGELGAGADGYGPDVQFNHPTNVEFDGDGNLLIAAWHNSIVKRMDLSTLQAVTIAGTGARAFNGDDQPGTSAALDLPSSVYFNSATGDVLISDQANFRIRLLEPNGTIHTICGDGTPGYTGDGGPAVSARINSPRGQSAPPAGRLTLNAEKEIIFADTGNHVVRKIDGAGVISLVAGTPNTAGYSGDGGPATAATLNTPSDVAVAPDGAIIIADTMNHVVRRVDADGTITTIAGTGERGFDGDGGPADEAKLDRPYGVTVKPDGTVLVADTHNNRIRQITSTLPPDYVPPTPNTEEVEIVDCTGEAGSICTYLGTGQKGRNGDGFDRLHTVLYWPFDIEFFSNGRVIFLDWNNHIVREVNADDTITTIMGTDFVGDGPPGPPYADLTAAGAAPLTVDLNHPTDIQELPDGDIFIVAWHNHKFRVIDAADGQVRVMLGAGAGFVTDACPTGDGCTAVNTRANQPRGAVLTPGGDLFFVDQRNQRIRVAYNFAEDRGDAVVQTVVGTGTAGPTGDGLSGLETQVAFQAGGNPEPSGGITFDAATGILYYSDSQNHRIRKVEFSSSDYLTSVVTTIAGTGTAGFSGNDGPGAEAMLANPQDMEIGPDGDLYFADTNNSSVRRINLTTGVIAQIAGDGTEGYSGEAGPATAARLNRPFGIAFDSAGDLYISDTFNSRIRKVEMVY